MGSGAGGGCASGGGGAAGAATPATPAPAHRGRHPLLALAGAIWGCAFLAEVIGWARLPQAYNKDFVQDYLLARAVAAGAAPYQPVTGLAARFLGRPVGLFAHPSPHPPPVGLLLWPLAALDYRRAALLWLALELACLALGLLLLARAEGLRLGVAGAAALAVAAVSWYLVREELMFGQLMTLLLVLAAGARAALLAGEDGRAGALLGATLLLKPLLWPLLALLLLRGRWRAAGAAGAAVAAGYGAAAAVLGPGTVLRYFTTVLPDVDAVYRASGLNLSLSALGPRLCDGTGSPVQNWIAAPPLIHEAAAGRALAVLLPAGALAVGWWATRGRALDVSLGVGVVVSILVSPIAWGFYLVLALLPLAQVAGRLLRRQAPPARATPLVAALLAIPLTAWRDVAAAAFGAPPPPLVTALAPLAPALGLMGLAWVLLASGAGAPAA